MTVSARPPDPTTHQTVPAFTERERVEIQTERRGVCLVYCVIAPNDEQADEFDSPYKTYLRTSSKLYAERFANRLADTRAAWFEANEPEGL